MVLRIINATEAKAGTNILLDGVPYTVKNVDISKTGKHGAHKCRIEAIGMLNGQKKIILAPGHERFEVPLVEKKRAQVLSIGENVSVMDLESFETIELPCDPEIKSNLEEGSNVEYWEIEGAKIVKRKV